MRIFKNEEKEVNCNLVLNAWFFENYLYCIFLISDTSLAVEKVLKGEKPGKVNNSKSNTNNIKNSNAKNNKISDQRKRDSSKNSNSGSRKNSLTGSQGSSREPSKTRESRSPSKKVSFTF